MEEARTPDETGPAGPSTEDDRRQKAAEVNRKRAEEQWNRNKKRWIDENFPERKRPG